MSYNKTNWQNSPSTNTPINAANLNHMEQGIYDATNTADSAAAGVAALQGLNYAPIPVTLAADMTDQNKIYVYLGSEAGYQNGHWYYWSGSAWTEGGAYNSLTFVTDKTLAIPGEAADAFETGFAIQKVQKEVNDGLANALYESFDIDVEQGGMQTTSWLPAASTIRARTNVIPYNQNYVFKFPQGVKHRFCVRYTTTQDNNPVFYYENWSSDVIDSVGALPVANPYQVAIRILLGYTDDRTIDNTNLPDVTMICKTKNFDGSIATAPADGYYTSSTDGTMGTIPYFVFNSSYIAANVIKVKPSPDYAFTAIRAFVVGNNFSNYAAKSTSNTTALRFYQTGASENIVLMGWRKSDTTDQYCNEDNVFQGFGSDNLIVAPLKGKKLSILGDSISAFTGHTAGYTPYYTGSNSGVDRYTQMWWQVLCDKTGMVPLVINAESGSAVTQLEEQYHIAKIPMSSDERTAGLNSGATNPDVIIIAGGVNDYTYAMSAQSEPLDWDGHSAPTISNSFTEAYACMIKKLQTNYPNAIIIALSTWFTMRGTDNGYTLTHGVNSHTYTQQDYNNKIKAVCEQMHIPYIDVSNIGFNRNNFYPTYAEDSSTVPTHPNAKGQKVMGEAIARKMAALVKAYLN